jgi:ATP-dependent exoDNAse (exonuclease V) beta subunit
MFYQLQVASDSVGAVAAAARAREADVTFLVQKLAAAEQQLQSNKAAGGVLRAALRGTQAHAVAARFYAVHRRGAQLQAARHQSHGGAAHCQHLRQEFVRQRDHVAAGAVAGEIAARFAAWRRAAGVQTFNDQVSAARDLLRHPATLAAVRATGWRVLLDEAQDTDETQFSILVELTRPPDAEVGSWPGTGAPPLPGRFCMVGDGQQAIYSSRASVRTFQRYLAAFDGAAAGDRLAFEVTFRAPHASVGLLNSTLPAAFSSEREHNLGLPPADGASAPFLQVPYQPLVAGPGTAPGRVAPAAPGSAVILRREWASVSHAGSADSASGGPWANISSGGP